MNFLQKIQNKPHHWKKRFALTLTGIVVFIIFIFWIGIMLPKQFKEVGQNGSVATTSVFQDINRPLVSFGSVLGQYVLELKSIFKSSATTTSTTSSSTDLVQ